MRVARRGRWAVGALVGVCLIGPCVGVNAAVSPPSCPPARQFFALERPIAPQACKDDPAKCRGERTKLPENLDLRSLCTPGSSPPPNSPLTLLETLRDTLVTLTSPTGLSAEQRFSDCHAATVLFEDWSAQTNLSFEQWMARTDAPSASASLSAAASALEKAAEADDAATTLRCTMPLRDICGGGEATVTPGAPVKLYSTELKRAYRHWAPWLRVGAAAERELRGADPNIVAQVRWWDRAFRFGSPPPAQDASRINAPFPASATELHGAICASRRLADELVAYHAALSAVLRAIDGIDLSQRCDAPGDARVFHIPVSTLCEVRAVVNEIEAMEPRLREGGNLATAEGLQAVEEALRMSARTLPKDGIEGVRTRWQQVAKDLRVTLQGAIADVEAQRRGAVREVQREAEAATNRAIDAAGEDLAASAGLALGQGLGADTHILHRDKHYCLLGQFQASPGDRLDYEIQIGLPVPRVGAPPPSSADGGCFGANVPTWVVSTGRVFTDVTRMPDGRVRINSAPMNMGDKVGEMEALLRGLGVPSFVAFAPIEGQIARVVVTGEPAEETLGISIEAFLVMPWLESLLGAPLDPIKVTLALGANASQTGIDPAALVRDATRQLQRQMVARLAKATDFQLEAYAGPFVRWRGMTVVGDTESTWDRGVPRFAASLQVLNPEDPSEVWLTSTIELRLINTQKGWQLELGTPRLTPTDEARARLAVITQALRREVQDQLAAVSLPEDLTQAILDAIEQARLVKAELRRAEKKYGAGVTLEFEWSAPALGSEPLTPIRVMISPKANIEIDAWGSEEWEVLGKRYLAMQARRLQRHAERELLAACRGLDGRRLLGGRIRVQPEDCGVEEARESFEIFVDDIPTLEGQVVHVDGMRLVNGKGEVKPSLAQARLAWGDPKRPLRPIDATWTPVFVADLLNIPPEVGSTLLGVVGVLRDEYIPVRITLDLPFVGRLDDIELKIGLDGRLTAPDDLRKVLEEALLKKVEETALPLLQDLVGEGVKITRIDTADLLARKRVSLEGTVPIPGLSSPLHFTWDLPDGVPQFNLDDTMRQALVEAALGPLISWLSAATGSEIKAAVDTTRRPIAVAIDAEARFAGYAVPMPRLLVSSKGIDVTWPLAVPLTGVQINAGPFAFVDPTIWIDGTPRKQALGLSGKMTLLTKGVDVLLHLDSEVWFQLDGTLTAKHSGRTILLEKLELFRSEGEITLDPAEVTFRNASGSLFSKILSVKEKGRIKDDLAELGGGVDIFGAKVANARITIDNTGTVEAHGAVDLVIGELSLDLTSKKFPSDISVVAHGGIGVGDFSLSVRIEANPHYATLGFRIFGVGLTLRARSIDQFTPAMILEAILALFDFDINIKELLKELASLKANPEFTLGGKVGGDPSSNPGANGGKVGGNPPGGQNGAAPPPAPPHPAPAPKGGTAVTPPAVLAPPGHYRTGFLVDDACAGLYWQMDDFLRLDGPFPKSVMDVLSGGVPLVGFGSSVTFHKQDSTWRGGRAGSHVFGFSHAGATGQTAFSPIPPNQPAAPLGVVVQADGQAHRAYAVALVPPGGCDQPPSMPVTIEMQPNLVHRLIPGWSVWGWRDGADGHALEWGDRTLLESEARGVFGDESALRLSAVHRIALPEPEGAQPKRWAYRYAHDGRAVLHFRHRSAGESWPVGSFLTTWWIGGPNAPQETVWWSGALDAWPTRVRVPPPLEGPPMTWRDVLALHLAVNQRPSRVWPVDAPPRLLTYPGRAELFPRNGLWHCDTSDTCFPVRLLRQGLADQAPGAAPTNEGVRAAQVVHQVLARLAIPQPERTVADNAKAPPSQYAAAWAWMARLEPLQRELVIAARSDRATHLEIAEIATTSDAAQCFRVAIEELEAFATNIRPVCGAISLSEGVTIGRWLDRMLDAPAGAACPSPWLVLKDLANDVGPCPTSSP